MDIELTKKDWEEVLKQNTDIAKQYALNGMIAIEVIKMAEKAIKKFPEEKEIKEEKK